jgi:hypothetical protein
MEAQANRRQVNEMAGAEHMIGCSQCLQATDSKQLIDRPVGTMVAMLMAGAPEARGW